MTFVVKDGLQETWEHDAETINVAQSAYELRGDIKTLSDAVDNLKTQICHREGEQHPDKANQVSDYAIASMRIETVSAVVERLYEQSRHVNILAGVLPKDDPNRQKAGEVPAQVDRFYNRAKHIRLSLDISIEDTAPVMEWEATTGKEANALETQLFVDLTEAAGSLDKLEAAIMDDAAQERKRNERNSNIAWWTTATLFLLGWALGLLGKLYGVSEAAGGE